MRIEIGDPVLVTWSDGSPDLGFVTGFGQRDMCSVRFGKKFEADSDKGTWIEGNIPLDICQRLVVDAA
jgi:hypothetical protein